MVDFASRVNRAVWDKLRDKFAPNNSESFLGFSTIDFYIRLLESEPNLPEAVTEIYCLNGDWSDGTFVIVVRQWLCILMSDFPYLQLQDSFSPEARVYLGTAAESRDRLYRLLKVVSYPPRSLFSNVLSKEYEVLAKSAFERNFTVTPYTDSVFYILRYEQALKYSYK